MSAVIYEITSYRLLVWFKINVIVWCLLFCDYELLLIPVVSHAIKVFAHGSGKDKLLSLW